jgi:hypothetical protein
VERGLNKKSALSICKYHAILIYSWLAWFTIVAVRICILTQGRIIMKKLLLFLIILSSYELSYAQGPVWTDEFTNFNSRCICPLKLPLFFLLHAHFLMALTG